MEPQSFTVEYANIVPQLITDCGVCEAYIPTSGNEHPKILKVRALWDTGATKTTISENIVKALNLIPIGFGDVSHAGGTRKAGLYKLSVVLPNGLQSPPMKVLDGVLYGFDVLIGWILSHRVISQLLILMGKQRLRSDCPLSKNWIL